MRTAMAALEENKSSHYRIIGRVGLPTCGLGFVGRPADDGRHFDARNERRVADALAGRVEAQVDPVRHGEIVGGHAPSLVVELRRPRQSKFLVSFFPLLQKSPAVKSRHCFR